MSSWFPYQIPPVPAGYDPNSDYGLSFNNSAVPNTNPTPYLEWKTFSLPSGNNKGDILYWDPSVEENGAWRVLSAPQNNQLRVLTIQSGNLEWIETEDCL
jgi:hypothetical protein